MDIDLPPATLAVCHYELRGKVIKRFGSPFLLHIRPGDDVASTLKRIGDHMGVAPKEAALWSLALLRGGLIPLLVAELAPDAIVLEAIKQHPGKPTETLHIGVKHQENKPKPAGIVINAPVGDSSASSSAR